MFTLIRKVIIFLYQKLIKKGAIQTNALVD